MYYTYCLTFKSSGQRYYGVSWKHNSHPDQLGKTYFSSSWFVKRLITNFGKDAFEYEIRKTFKCPKKARQWETKVLRRLKVATNENWLNLSQGYKRSKNKMKLKKYSIAYGQHKIERLSRSEHAKKKSTGCKWMHHPKTLKERFSKPAKCRELELAGYVYGRSCKSYAYRDKRGNKNPAYGKKRLDLSNRNKLEKGKICWITNGVNNRRVLLTNLHSYPDFKRGRTL
jgi:hypothetical protein